MTQPSKSAAGQVPAPESPAKKKEELHREEMLDEALEETFPASDPVSLTEPGNKTNPKS